LALSSRTAGSPEPSAGIVSSRHFPSFFAPTVMPRPSGVQAGRYGDSPVDSRASVPFASTAHRSDSVDVPTTTAMRAAVGAALQIAERRGVSSARCTRPSRSTHDR
jgi:hypothetical protein